MFLGKSLQIFNNILFNAKIISVILKVEWVWKGGYAYDGVVFAIKADDIKIQDGKVMLEITVVWSCKKLKGGQNEN